MIENDTKKVYIVNNLKSDNIEQVIFILRENSTTKKNLHSDSDIALEAERVSVGVDSLVILIGILLGL